VRGVTVPGNPLFSVEKNDWLLSKAAVIEADDARDPPHAVLVLPEVNELRFADFVVVRMVEAVDADLDGAVIGDGIDLQRAGNELPGDFSANVILDGLDDSDPRASQAGFIVIKLQIIGQQRAEFYQIAMVVGVEELGVQRLDGLEKRVGKGGGLRAHRSEGSSE
jgi:hypothetical protein